MLGAEHMNPPSSLRRRPAPCGCRSNTATPSWRWIGKSIFATCWDDYERYFKRTVSIKVKKEVAEDSAQLEQMVLTLAEALGCVGLRCERAEDVEDVINQARAINDRPVVIDFIVGADAQVWPMVAAGTSNDEIQAARGIRPLFDDPEEGHA